MSTPNAEPGSKGKRRRDSLVQAAATLLLRDGAAAVTQRRVAAQAGASLSATSYYFGDAQQLLTAAGELLVQRWAARARQVGAQVSRTAAPAERLAAAVDAILPSTEHVRGHYEHLAGAGRNAVLAAAYATGREAVDAAVEQITGPLGLQARTVITIVDGAAITALSENRDPHVHAQRLLVQNWQAHSQCR